MCCFSGTDACSWGKLDAIKSARRLARERCRGCPRSRAAGSASGRATSRVASRRLVPARRAPRRAPRARRCARSSRAYRVPDRPTPPRESGRAVEYHAVVALSEPDHLHDPASVPTSYRSLNVGSSRSGLLWLMMPTSARSRPSRSSTRRTLRGLPTLMGRPTSGKGRCCGAAGSEPCPARTLAGVTTRSAWWNPSTGRAGSGGQSARFCATRWACSVGVDTVGSVSLGPFGMRRQRDADGPQHDLRRIRERSRRARRRRVTLLSGEPSGAFRSRPTASFVRENAAEMQEIARTLSGEASDPS